MKRFEPMEKVIWKGKLYRVYEDYGGKTQVLLTKNGTDVNDYNDIWVNRDKLILENKALK